MLGQAPEKQRQKEEGTEKGHEQDRAKAKKQRRTEASVTANTTNITGISRGKGIFDHRP